MLQARPVAMSTAGQGGVLVVLVDLQAIDLLQLVDALELGILAGGNATAIAHSRQAERAGRGAAGGASDGSPPGARRLCRRDAKRHSAVTASPAGVPLVNGRSPTKKNPA